MKNLDKILREGCWYSEKDCPNSPKRLLNGGGVHRFKDVSRKKGKEPGEILITSMCEYCGGIIKDCPTIGLVEFSV